LAIELLYGGGYSTKGKTSYYMIKTLQNKLHS